MGGIAKGLLGGGSKGGSASTSSQVVVPGWLDTRNKSLASRADNLSSKQYVPYTGQRIANLADDSQTAFDLTRQSVGKYDNLLNSASQGAIDLMGRSNGPTSEQISALMNPYLQNVLDISKRETINDAARSQQELARQKGLAGSFGGSRFALRESQEQNDLNQRLQDLQYKGQFDAFNNAQGQFNKGTEALGGGIESLLASIAGGQAIDQSDITNLLKSGELQRASEQDKLDVQYDDFLKEQSWDYDQVNFLANILNPLTGGYKGQESTTTQKSGESGGGFGKILGTAASIASLFSDERIKENIKDVGVLDNGLTVYSYNYKGSPKTQIGVMAQDVEKKNPEAVTETKDGIKMVDYDKATKAEFADGGRVNFNRLIEAMTRPVSQISGTSFSAPSITPPAASSGGSGIDAGGIEGLKNLFGNSNHRDGALGGFLSNVFGSTDADKYSAPIGPTMSAGADGFMGLDSALSGGGDLGWLSSLTSFFGFAEGGPVLPFLRQPTSYSDRMMERAEDEEIEKYLRDAQRVSGRLPIDSETQSYGGMAGRGALNALSGAASEIKNIPSFLRSAKTEMDATIDTGANELVNGFKDIFLRDAVDVNRERLAEQGRATSSDQELSNIKDQIQAKKDVAPKAGNIPAAPVVAPKPAARKAAAPTVQPTSFAPSVGASRLDDNLMRNIFVPQKTAEPAKKEGGINMPLLMAGLAMMQSNGDDGLISNIADGIGAATSYLGEEKRREEATKAAEAEQRQQEFKNMLDILKLEQVRELAAQRRGLTPYQARMLDLKDRELDIRERGGDGTSLIPTMEDPTDTIDIDMLREILGQIE